MTTFFSKYKVFIMGLIGAIVLAIVNIDSSNGLTWSDLVMPVILAISSYVATNLRGQWVSIVGIFFSVLIGFVQARMQHTSWSFDAKTLQFIVAQLAILFFGYNAPPFKTAGYEKTATIENAKRQGDQITKNE